MNCKSTSRNLCNNHLCHICNTRRLSNYIDDKYWLYDKNGISPKFVTKGTSKKYWFSCKKCGHHIDKTPSNFLNKDGCKYCSNKAQGKLCDDENCKL